MSFFRLNEKVLAQFKKKKHSEHPWDKKIKGIYNKSYKYGHNSVNNPPYPEEKQIKYEGRTKIVVIGNKTTKEFIYCYYLVKGLCKYRKKEYEEPVIRGVLGIEWPIVIRELWNQYGPRALCISDQVLVIVNGDLVGEAKDLEKYLKSKYVYHLCLDYYKEGVAQLVNHIKSSGRPCVYIDISINGENEGTMLFLLYSDVVPRTCENFLRLCEATRGGFAGTPVHRIVKDCWIQCGGFTLKEDPKLGCENFIVPPDKRGVLCMTNDGRHVACSTQFFILLQPAPWMAKKYVAFGQLIEGEKILTKISNVPTWYESPTQNIIIERAGLFDLDCHHIPINKKTKEYITGHIDDIYELEEFFWEMILEEAFEEIDCRERIRQETLGENGIRNVEEEVVAESEILAKGEYEGEGYDADTYQHVSVGFSEPSLPPVPTKPYYIPLTDVPYPGEIDSTFDLKKIIISNFNQRELEQLTERDNSTYFVLRLLTGNYCYDPVKRLPDNTINPARRRFTIPQNLLSILFESYVLSDDDNFSESSLDSDAEEILAKYVRLNSDNVSFAGTTIKKMANIPGKFKIFDYKGKEMNQLLNDEELRVKRVATKEYCNTREKKVLIDANSSSLHSTIIRRLTGHIKASDIAKLGIDDELMSEVENSDVVLTGGRDVRDSLTRQDECIFALSRPRESVLVRLLHDIAEDANDAPTFKSRLRNAQQDKEYVILFHSGVFARNDDAANSPEIEKQASLSKVAVDKVLKLQHGERLYRKFSSDYVKTINIYEHKGETPQSFRTFEFSKIRPSMSVAQYKMKNKKHGDKLKISTNVQRKM